MDKKNTNIVPIGWFDLAKRNFIAIINQETRQSVLRLMVKELERDDIKIIIAEYGDDVQVHTIDWESSQITFTKSDDTEPHTLSFDDLLSTEITIESRVLTEDPAKIEV